MQFGFFVTDFEVNTIFIFLTLLTQLVRVEFINKLMELIMKIILKSSFFAILLAFSQMSTAGSFIDTASVVSVDKVYKQVRVEEPYNECYIKETVQNSWDGSATNEIIGGVIGGAIGNQFGEGSGKYVMTLAGILMGASIANDAEKAAGNGKQTIVSQEVWS